jgi:peroxiredoxin
LLFTLPASAASTGLPPIAYGKTPPNFSYDAGNGEHRLSDWQGQPVLIHFWDSWCGPCKEELPLIVRARQRDPHLRVILLSDEEPEATHAYLKEQGIDLPVVIDQHHRVFRAYGVHAIPVSVFLGRDGTVEHVSVGEMDWKEIEGALEGARP